jgi:hypothetical protein
MCISYFNQINPPITFSLSSSSHYSALLYITFIHKCSNVSVFFTLKHSLSLSCLTIVLSLRPTNTIMSVCMYDHVCIYVYIYHRYSFHMRENM